MALSSPLDRHILSIQFFPQVLLKLHTAPGMTSFLLSSGCCTSGTGNSSLAFSTRGRNFSGRCRSRKSITALTPSRSRSEKLRSLLQLLFQALHLYQQLSVLVFKPLPLLSLLQLFFCRGDFLLKPLDFLPSALAPSVPLPHLGSPPPSVPLPVLR